MDLTQRDLLAKTLQAEAGNQGYNGMVAVGSVIMNRLAGGSDLGKVILQPGHFSAWNSTTGYAGGEQGQDMNFTPSAKAYEVADALLSGNYEDPTGGATHYYNPQLADPNWGASAGGDWQTIGSHIFGKANKAGPKPIPNNGTMTESLEAKIFGGASAMDGQSTGRNMQQPSAIQMQKMQQQQGSGGLMGFLRDPRTREAFASMDVSGRLGGIQQRAAADVEKQETQNTANRTAQWLRTQPDGEKYAQAIENGMNASTVYSQYMREKAIDKDPSVQSRTMLPDNSGSVVIMRDGSQFVLTSGGRKLTGIEAENFVVEAQSNYTRQQKDIYGARKEGGLEKELEFASAIKQAETEGAKKILWVDEIRAKRDNIQSTIGSYDMALAALDSGAETGRVSALLPTVTSQTQLLESAKQQLGLDVIGSVTFGALSESELNLAMDAGLPSDKLSPEQLREWILERKDAKKKAAQALLETAQYLSRPGTTYESYYSDFLGIEPGNGTAIPNTSSDNPLGLTK